MLVRYFAAAAEAAGQQTQELDATDLTTAELVAQLGAGNPALAKILAVSALLADGARAQAQTPLAGVQQLDVLPPFAGG